MKLMRYESVEVLASLCCDRCGTRADATEPAFHEFISVDHLGGYGSAVGDGVRVQVDFCETCFRELAGPWLRLSTAEGPATDHDQP